MKWPEKKPLTQHYDDLSNGFDTGFNYAIDDCRAALEEKCERMVLAFVLQNCFRRYAMNQTKEMPTFEEMADAIRRHLGLV